MFKNEDTAEYYNTTQHHYENWWNLADTLSLHYGIWDESTTNFRESLINTNEILFKTAGIKDGDRILDAGCGVGGAAFFMVNKADVNVTGITLSEKQVALAQAKKEELNLQNNVSFELMDYTNTRFPDNSFDVIWTCESVCHTVKKEDFIQEAYRILKPGGKVVIAEYCLINDNQKDKHSYIAKWIKTWSITNLCSSETFAAYLEKGGFINTKVDDYTKGIKKSAWKMFLAGIIGGLPSIAYNLTHPNASRFGKTHYKGCYYQYKALKAKLWSYKIFCGQKPL